MRPWRASPRGSILLLVLAVLAMLTILGATFSRSVHDRALSAQRIRRGGTLHLPRATIGDGARVAPINEEVHGSQTIPAGGDDRLRGGLDR
jgi:hypothetical protein